MVATMTVRLRETNRAELVAHFLSLEGEDRRLRFGSFIADAGIHEYVARIDFERDGVFAVQDDDLKLVGVVHAAFSAKNAELGLSVLPGYRAQGVGNVLFARAVMHLRNRGAREVFVHCLTENAAMMHISRKHGMRLVQEGSESEARLKIEPATSETLLAELLHEHGSAAVSIARHGRQLARSLRQMFAVPAR